MMAKGMRVDLPQASAAHPLDPQTPIVITLTSDGAIEVDGQPIAHDEILQAVDARVAGDPTRTIHLRADKHAVYGDAVAILDLLAGHGILLISH